MQSKKLPKKRVQALEIELIPKSLEGNLYFIGPAAYTINGQGIVSTNPLSLSNQMYSPPYRTYKFNELSLFGRFDVQYNTIGLSTTMSKGYTASGADQSFQLSTNLTGTITWSISYDPPLGMSPAPSVSSSGKVTIPGGYNGNFTVTATNGTNTVTFNFGPSI